MPLTHEQVLDYVKQKGPSVPNDIRQGLKAQDNFIVGAILSELLGQGKLKMSNLSLGTSKFYYDPEHPQVLQNIAQHLNEKDLRAFQLLKEHSVLRNSELEPLMRVAMVNIPDYSRSIRMQSLQGAEELFWRYFLVSEQVAQELIQQKYFGKEKKASVPLKTPDAGVGEAPVRFGKKISKQVQSKEVTSKTSDIPPQETKVKPVVKVKSVSKATKDPFADGFAKQVKSYFESKNIELLQVISSTKTELTCFVRIPSAVGNVTYFCKAKSKKTTSDGDLASALLEAQQQKLSLFFVAGGTLSKKATNLLSTQLRGAVVVTPWA